MLGIGFIITHFVAMQKPQQRKYHSSCNRSVHRGTAHGKQKVKVCKRKTPHLFLMRSFLSPYGDKLQSIVKLASAIARYALSSPCGDSTGNRLICRAFNGFSPPYGDGTEDNYFNSPVCRFSPPCGECTLNISQNTAKLKSRMARKYSLYCNDVFLRCKEQP